MPLKEVASYALAMYFMRCWEKRPGMYSESELLEKSLNGALSAHNSAGPAFGVNLQQSCRSRHSKPVLAVVMLSNPVVLNCVPPNDSQSKQFAVPLSCTCTKTHNKLMSGILNSPIQGVSVISMKATSYWVAYDQVNQHVCRN